MVHESAKQPSRRRGRRPVEKLHLVMYSRRNGFARSAPDRTEAVKAMSRYQPSGVAVAPMMDWTEISLNDLATQRNFPRA
jgi:hypothetical protein